MSMIDCINNKNIKEKRGVLISEMHNDIEALDAMRTRLREAGASSDILVMMERTREQIRFERGKMVAGMNRSVRHE